MGLRFDPTFDAYGKDLLKIHKAQKHENVYRLITNAEGTHVARVVCLSDEETENYYAEKYGRGTKKPKQRKAK